MQHRPAQPLIQVSPAGSDPRPNLSVSDRSAGASRPGAPVNLAEVRAATTAARTEVVAIVEACNAAGRPRDAIGFLESGATLADVRQALAQSPASPASGLSASNPAQA